MSVCEALLCLLRPIIPTILSICALSNEASKRTLILAKRGVLETMTLATNGHLLAHVWRVWQLVGHDAWYFTVYDTINGVRKHVQRT